LNPRRVISACRPISASREFVLEFPLEKLSLILAAEGDLKSNPAIGLGNRLERDRLDFAVVQPHTDRVHNISE
jgi:hypothetical protein